MGSKIFSIIIAIFLVLGLVYLVFLNSKIIKNDNTNLGGSHYLILDNFVDGSLTSRDISTGGSSNVSPVSWANYLAMFSVATTGLSSSDYTLTIFFDLPSTEYEGDLSPYILEIRLSYGWSTNIENRENITLVNSFEGSISKTGNIITISRGSRFLINFNSKYIIDTYISTFHYLSIVRPRFDYVDGNFEITDVGEMVADIFYNYPAWLISHITLPFKVLGGVFNW